MSPQAINATLPSCRRTACRIETLRVVERVVVHLRGLQLERTNGYRGRVIDVDCRAIRIDLEAERFDWHWSRRDGQIVVPWGRVESVRGSVLA